jgi:hypothetical protein
MIDVVAYILIVVGANTGAVTSIEFSNEASCLVAKQKIEEFRTGANYRYSAICTPKKVIQK